MEVNGVGSDISDKSVLLGRAKRKLISQKVVLSLINYAKKKEDKEMGKSLWNTYHCQNKIIVSNQKLYGKYCKNRICTVCNSIRKADMINNYLPIVQSWEDPCFVTLTAKSCYANKLYKRMRNTKRAYKIIAERLKKRYQRGKGPN